MSKRAAIPEWRELQQDCGQYTIAIFALYPREASIPNTNGGFSNDYQVQVFNQ